MSDALKFVIAGHMDHGKSTLIGRILYDTESLPEGKLDEVKKTCEMLGRPLEFAYLVDHLREERENEMTIDTAQTFFRWQGREYAIIDAPGHKEFMKNMVTGASQADAAVLIIDASEGLQEQTRRHAYALSLLGINQIAVAVNKMDKVGYGREAFEKLRLETIAFLERLGIPPAFIIPASALNGDNVIKMSQAMAWYSGPSLIGALRKFEAQKTLAEKPLRLPIQDVYEINGRRLAVGRVESGVIAAGAAIAMPSGKGINVPELEAFGCKPEKVEAGMPAAFFDASGLKRGDVVCSGRLPCASKKFVGSVFWLAEKPLLKGEMVIVRIATQEARAKVEAIRNRVNSSTLEVIEENAEKLEGVEAAEIRFYAEKPLVFDAFCDVPTMGRFVIAREGIIQGGGIISKAVQ